MSLPPKKFTDVNQSSNFIVDITNNEINSHESSEGKNPAAVALGRLGGQKGGKARANSLSAEKRSEIARLGAKARWEKDSDDD